MQFGITIPLQKFLNMKKPSYGMLEDLFFCWEIHQIPFHGMSALIAVNANNRFFVMRYGMKAHDWKQWSKRVEETIWEGFLAEGYSEAQIASYFQLAGKIEQTKTHGRRPVAGLNKAIDHLCCIPVEPSKTKLYQPYHCCEINRGIYRPVGFELYGYPVEFLERDMRRIGIFLHDLPSGSVAQELNN